MAGKVSWGWLSMLCCVMACYGRQGSVCCVLARLGGLCYGRRVMVMCGALCLVGVR